MSKTIKGVKTTEHDAAEALLAGRDAATQIAKERPSDPVAAFLVLDAIRVYLQPHIDAARTAALAAQSEQPKPKPVAAGPRGAA